MSRFSSLLCSLLFCMITYAQEITVTGKVTAGGEEMPGVTVAVKGQTRGTITSIDGSYQIQVNGNESLIFSFVGYETVTIPVNRRKVINVELKEAAQMVDEVVITVPYGTAKKSTFTGSASYIAAGTIKKMGWVTLRCYNWSEYSRHNETPDPHTAGCVPGDFYFLQLRTWIHSLLQIHNDTFSLP